MFPLLENASWADMVLTLEDDGCVHVYDSVGAVCLAVEALDAEDCLRAVFDDAGQRYAIEWLRPNVHGRFGSVGNGEYRLVPVGPPVPADLLAILATDPPVFPPRDRAAVATVKEQLAGRT
jgi:hypothetical protein